MKDHPRVCGEHLPVCGVAGFEQGSSPRMRGALAADKQPGRFFRIIPAYAGSTPQGRPHPPRTRDHPRVCGEHLSNVRSRCGADGSSPRMRGALSVEPAHGRGRRIIPAYAGSTLARPMARPSIADHPRVCGEHEAEESKKAKEEGSSPRMRGALVHRIPDTVCGRIIPAYAGSTP